jgi:hypothetical protein
MRRSDTGFAVTRRAVATVVELAAALKIAGDAIVLDLFCGGLKLFTVIQQLVADRRTLTSDVS